MADEELDSLYEAPPKEFTAERARLAAAAKERGDDAAAKRISATNKPTTAAWVINRLALRHADTRQRLADLGERLRAAHAAMDGGTIRDLSAEQRKLIDELTRKALQAADLAQPSATVREALTSTLQAAIADPKISERLGRLTRPEQWSGFGSFGDAAPESVDTSGEPAKRRRTPPVRKRPAKQSASDSAEQRRREKLSTALAAAERAKAEADDLVAELRAQRDAAQQRRDAAARALRAAEQQLQGAEKDYGKAQQAGRAAAKAVTEAKNRLKRA